MNATPESLMKDYADPIEQQEIDKFVCSEMGRQIHRYIKGMSGTKQAMLKVEERLASLSVPAVSYTHLFNHQIEAVKY